MTTAIPQRPPQRNPPPSAPPSGPLPALPMTKTRKPLPDIPDDPESRPASSASSIATPASRPPIRAVTSSGLPTPRPTKIQSTPAVPTLNTSTSTSTPGSGVTSPGSSALPTPGKSLRKTTSIGAFPAPPNIARVNSLPPSPLSTSTSTSDINGIQQNKSKRESTKHRSSDVGVKKLKTRSSGYGLRSRASAGSTLNFGASPSLLNGTGDSNLISSARGARGSDSLLSLPSPPQSRSSSANGSYHTDGTQFEEFDEPVERGRPKSQDTLTDKRNPDGKDSKGNVLVSVRVRPDAANDNAKPDGEWMVDGRRSLIAYNGREGGDYRYDNVFSPHDDNARVYDSAAKRLVRRVMEGYHGTVFAYGMTGTGKTFSMQGTAGSPGVIPLAISDIFSYIRENPAREFLLRVSYLEIYNEKIHDLLSQSTPGVVQEQEIKLREDAKRGVYATPLKEEIVQSPNQLLRVIARGDMQRRTSSTQFNARSSRSHAVVQIVVESRERAPSHGAYFDKEQRRSDRILPGGVCVSTLSLIDLAGSEKAAENKERRAEGAHINKSLLTLGTVIARLSGEDEKEDGGKASEKDKEKGLKHLPYRDSKLTRLLQPALSGNSLVSILCTIQLSSAGTSAAATGLHTGETLNTLKFASRAKNNIVSHAKKNESNPNAGDAGSRALLDRYRIEIQELRSQLDQQNKAKEEAEKQEEIEKDRKMEEELERAEQNRHEEQMLEMQLARTALKERISHLNRLILSSKSLGVNSGRLSSMSLISAPPVNRMSNVSTNEFGRPVSQHSRDSVHSTQSHQINRDSSATLEVPMPNSKIGRTVSVGSITSAIMPAANVSRLAEEDEDTLDEEDESPGELGGGMDGEGSATLAQQNRMLQADLTDKTRYIATLEKRLLQARRTSHSRVSMQLANRASQNETSAFELVLREKDKEIEELKARLDDQTRMVNALRSAARKRDMLDPATTPGAADDEEEVTQQQRPASANALMTTPTAARRTSSRLSNRSLKIAVNGPPIHHKPTFSNGGGHKSNPSTASRSSSSVVNFSKLPLSPMTLLSPTGSDRSDDHPHPHSHHTHGSGSGTARPADAQAKAKAFRRKSVDEMTMLLDQMIQDKVESGQVLRGERGSLRVKRDTVMEQRGLGEGGEGVENSILEEEGEGVGG
ncbi:Kinesin-like protein kip2 [Saxophila tyrrhenica]|uniref:Kinesin-like protein KIP2 n=1 Tax=Saxophila tyrrhenica TaxID=1690608 RepID=A0AAV9PME1_9PEZI|nr:Kinesin-like protein kip2 [Saxophila tyrrhenica]